MRAVPVFILVVLAAAAVVAVAGTQSHHHHHHRSAWHRVSDSSNGLLLPTDSQLKWSRSEIGVIIHFDTSTFSATASRSLGCTPPSWGTPPLDWHTFAPTAVNTTQWAAAASSLGAKYAVLAAKHACGFTLWPTKATFSDGSAYMNSVANSQYHGDVAGEFVKAFTAAGVAPGFYYSLTQNVYLNEWDGKLYEPDVSPLTVNVSMDELLSIQAQQLTELWTNYGNLTEVWFDGGYPSIMEPMVAKLLPALQHDAVAFQGYPASPSPLRWAGAEDGSCPYPCWSTSVNADSGGGVPSEQSSATVWAPAESDFTLQNGDNWFYNGSLGLHTLHELVTVYHSSVGQNSNLLLDLAITPTGSLPQDAVDMYNTFGTWIRECYSNPLNHTSGTGTHFTLALGADEVEIDRIVLQEDQSYGQRIRTYSVSALVDGEWQQVATGTSVGNKRIHLLDKSVTTAHLVLDVTVASGVNVAVLRNFAAHLCTHP